MEEQHEEQHDQNKEKKRKKQLKRMTKMVAKAWELNHSEPFQEDPHLLSLSAVGQKIDEGGYGHGRHGWEDFARDIGGVYNRHIDRYVV
jgi:hypothetical protein